MLPTCIGISQITVYWGEYELRYLFSFKGKISKNQVLIQEHSQLVKN